MIKVVLDRFFKATCLIITSTMLLSPIYNLPNKLASAKDLNASKARNRLAGNSDLLDEQVENPVYLPLVNGLTSYRPGPSEGNWPMAGANPQRNSWTSEEVRGKLYPEWYKTFEPYIMQKVQIIAEYGYLYISTARGLYALDADTGDEIWVYPTEMPLGHSPTIVDGVAYVGGFDHKLHAVNAYTGEGLWKFAAEAGFNTNPLVVDNLVLAGNRDGYFYAVHASGPSQGKLAWKFKTGGPINYSATYKDGTIYFASNDSFAYAINAQTGELIWKSDKLPGAGFYSWWPVVYGEHVIYAGSNNYRTAVDPGPKTNYTGLELGDVYPNHEEDPRGTFVGPLGSIPGFWEDGTPTIDASQPNQTPNGSTTAITEYFESMPWRRTYFVLNRSNGMEVTYDFDNDGKPEYAPILWLGTHSGNRYPPIVGVDGVLYQGNNYMSDPTIAGGHISGWMVGTPYIGIVNRGWNAVDEPIAYSAGGNLIYWNRCCDRYAGAFDITIPTTVDARSSQQRGEAASVDRSWNYFSYNLPELIPGYDVNTYVWEPYYLPYGGVYGGKNGSYGFHGDVNPPIPYQGKVYMHRSNTIIAFSPGRGDAVQLPMAEIVETHNAGIPSLSDAQVISLLENEVEKMLAAGHLRPGYLSTGFLEFRSKILCGANLLDYWHNPADTIYTLLRTLPYTSDVLSQQTRSYLQNEYQVYPPYRYEHIGWKDGASREAFVLPPEVDSARANSTPQTEVHNFIGWSHSPFSFYALWKYAEVFGNAKEIFDASKGRLEPIPANEILLEMPHVHNAYIAGYWGYLELEKLAGYSESAQIRDELNRVLDLRVSSFTKDAPEVFFQNPKKFYCRNFNSSQNFMFLVPELAEYLRVNALAKVKNALEEYERVTPLWFASSIETAFAEGTINQLYDYNAMFQAKALILRETREELTKYLDVPSFRVGDLFYIQNLVSLLETKQVQTSKTICLTCKKFR